MFKKLHIQLTAFNLIILIALLFIFCAAIYFPLEKIIERDAKNDMLGFARGTTTKRIEFFINADPFFQTNVYFKDRIPFKYIIVLRDASSHLVFSSTDNINIIEKSKDITHDFLKQSPSETFTKSTIDGIPYRVYTGLKISNGGTYILQMYKDISGENKILLGFLKTIFTLGLFSIAILAFISWILAKRSLKPVKAAWEQQKQFISDASHELRTPISVIKTNLEIPLYDKDGTIEDNKQWIENAYNEANNLSHLINALLDITRIDSGDNSTFMTSLDISTLAEKTIYSMTPLFKEKGLKLSSEIHSMLMIYGDEMKLKQLIIILLDNALKYTEVGTVQLSLKAFKHNVELIITDTGIGIPKEDLEHIFDRFYRSDKSRSRTEGSLGLGLSIAKGIVNKHNGKINVESQVGVGTTFTVVVPKV